MRAYAAKLLFFWMRRSPDRLRALDVILIIQLVGWGIVMIMAHPPLDVQFPRLYAWTLFVGGSRVTGGLALALGVLLLLVSLFRKLHPVKIPALFLIVTWWACVAWAFGSLSWSLTSTPMYGTAMLTALFACFEHALETGGRHGRLDR
jgi:hypothetical protein